MRFTSGYFSDKRIVWIIVIGILLVPYIFLFHIRSSIPCNDFCRQVTSQNEISSNHLYVVNSSTNNGTFGFIINQPLLCQKKDIKDELLVIVFSASSNFAARLAIRETWGAYLKTRAKVIFLLGLSNNMHINREKIKNEAERCQDIVQYNSLDTYRTLAIKAVEMLKWAVEYCPHAKFVLKCDDDVFFNVDALLDNIKEINASKSIFGYFVSGGKFNRDKNSKFYVSKKEHPGDDKPAFVGGPAYLITGDSIPILYGASQRIPVVPLEDVYITGILANETGIKRISYNTYKDYPKINPCSYPHIVGSHHHSPKELKKLWRLVKSENFICKL